MWDRACIICWKFWEKKKCSRASIARWPCSNARSSRAKRGTSHKLETSRELTCVIHRPARDPSSSARLRMTHELFLCLFCPGVPQRNRAVPGLFLARAVGIEREVAEPLELIAFFGARAGKRRLAFRIHNFQRIWTNE